MYASDAARTAPVLTAAAAANTAIANAIDLRAVLCIESLLITFVVRVGVT
jgi:hypothetical protein